MKKLFYIFFFFRMLSNAQSAALIGFDYITSSDQTTIDSSLGGTSSKSTYSINLQFSTNQKKNIYFGWGVYNVATKDETNTQKANYATQDMGPSFRWHFGRADLYFINFIYGIKTQTTFDSGGTSETWLGTNYLFQFGISPEISDSLSASFALNYFSGSAKTKVVDSTQTDVTYTKAYMTPTLGIVYRW